MKAERIERPGDAAPERLLELWRGHWRIENQVHWVRDVTFDEDRCQVRTGAAPQVMAALRNLVIGLVRRTRATNLAAALRYYGWKPSEALSLLGAVGVLDEAHPATLVSVSPVARAFI